MRLTNPAVIIAIAALLAESAASETFIHNVNLVTMSDDGVIEGRALVVEDGRIAATIPEAETPRKGATIIDGGGGYLTPGLIDAHVHHDDLIDYSNYVANGVTTVIGLGQRNDGPSFRALRDAIDAGERIGPQIYTTNQTISNHIVIDEPATAREYVRDLKTDGYDLVKIYNDIPQPVFDAVVEEAHANGLAVFGHLPRNFPVEYTLSHGLDVVAHAEEFYFAHFGGPRDQQLDAFDGSILPDLTEAERVIDLMVENDVALIPNLTFTLVTMRFWDDENAALADPELRYWSEEVVEAWRRNNGARRDRIAKRMLRDRIKYHLMHELTRRALHAGVLIVTGTDAPVRGVIPGASLHSEMRELVKSGLSFEEALAAATRAGGELVARYVDEEARIGIIAAGYEADLVLVAENPLDDIRNMKDIEGVMVDGVWRNRDSLDAMRDRAAARATSPE